MLLEKEPATGRRQLTEPLENLLRLTAVIHVMRLFTATIALLTTLVFPIAPAEAGGAHLQWENEFSIPGDVVRGHAFVQLDGRSHNQGALRDGPYYAYLSHKDSSAPPLPSGSTRLARIEIDPRPGGKHADVTIEFVLPSLDPGYYWILNCNDPCRKIFGDLAAGQINVVADKSEARVLDLALRIGREVHGVDQRLQRKVLGERRSSLSTRVTALQQRVDQLEGQLQGVNRDREQRASPTSAYRLGAFVLASAAAGAVMVGRRRRKEESY